MGHDNDNDRDGLGGIGIIGCLLVLALAAAFWAGIYCVVSLIWSHL
jgi:hypothetical protein